MCSTFYFFANFSKILKCFLWDFWLLFFTTIDSITKLNVLENHTL